MAIEKKGSTRQLLNRDFEFQWGKGRTEIFYLNTVADQVERFVGSAFNLNFDVRTDHAKGAGQFVARRFEGGTSSNEDPTLMDRWGVSSEILEQSIFAHPDVYAESAAYSKGPSSYKKQIEEAARSDTPLAVDVAALPKAPKVLQELTRGVESFEINSLIIERSRTLPLDHATRHKQRRTDLFYRSATLSVIENIPTYVL